MKKTLKLIEHYHRVLREQGDMPPEDTQEFDTSGGETTEDVLDAPEEIPEEMPMTSEGENQYISDLIDAALYEPTSEDARLLNNLQSVMKMKKFTNAREEVLPTILSIIRPSTEENGLRDDLDQLS